jgi:hypothetical protein
MTGMSFTRELAGRGWADFTVADDQAEAAGTAYRWSFHRDGDGKWRSPLPSHRTRGTADGMAGHL